MKKFIILGTVFATVGFIAAAIAYFYSFTKDFDLFFNDHGYPDFE